MLYPELPAKAGRVSQWTLSVEPNGIADGYRIEAMVHWQQLYIT